VQEIGKRIALLPRALHLVWSAAPTLTIVWAALLLLQGAIPVASVYLIKMVVDSLVKVVHAPGDWHLMWPALFAIALTVGVMLLSDILDSVADLVSTAQSEFTFDHITGLLHRQALALDIAFYESPNYHDLLERARSEAASRSRGLLDSLGSLIQNAVTLIGMGAVLTRYAVWLPLVLLLGTLPAFYVLLRFDRRYHRWWEKSTTDRRKTQYYDMMLTHSDAAAEVRLFDLGSQFRAAYQGLRTRLRSERLDHLKKQSRAKFGAGVLALVFSGLALGWMLWRAFLGFVSLGDIALFYQALNRGQTLMRSLLGSAGKMYSSTLFISNLFTFLELKPAVSDCRHPVAAPAAVRNEIAFRNVSFRYPGSSRLAIEDFSLVVPAGKIVAIVGPNGAGKTTLVKLLCRFYDPEKGHLEIDGIDIRDFKISDWWGLLTVLFQFPEPYHATAAQNIGYGDSRIDPRPEALRFAAENAGADEFIRRLPQQYDTELGKWFATEGTQLSGGEWQRIALARAYWRKANIMILDEPTSAMDSWSETDWFDRLRKLAMNRIGIVITHRFTIAMRADIIHVMDKGRIVESGSHHDLLAQGGLYAQSWLAQMDAASNAHGPDCEQEVVNPMSLRDPSDQLATELATVV
jgi:ATP-binding cassette subfamily B protein